MPANEICNTNAIWDLYNVIKIIKLLSRKFKNNKRIEDNSSWVLDFERKSNPIAHGIEYISNEAGASNFSFISGVIHYILPI